MRVGPCHLLKFRHHDDQARNLVVMIVGLIAQSRVYLYDTVEARRLSDYCVISPNLSRNWNMEATNHAIGSEIAKALSSLGANRRCEEAQ